MDPRAPMVKGRPTYWLEVLEDDGIWYREVGWDDRLEAERFAQICIDDGITVRIVED